MMSGMSDSTLPFSPPPVTGIFYHPSFSRKSYLTQGSRLFDFPRALKPFLDNPRFRLYESPPIPEELILKVHTRELLEGVRRDPLCSTAWHSAGGVVMAAEKIASREIRNGFAFIGAGGHHSGKDFFGGFCCFNDVVLAIHTLRESHGIRRIAILDTDAHHGDGTRALVRDDPDVLHVCVCSMNQESADGAKVDITAPGADRWSFLPQGRVEDDVDVRYARAASEAFESRVRAFRPEFIFWYFGFDTHSGDYGDLGLSVEADKQIAIMVKNLAAEICCGRLEVVLGGGSMSEIARTVIPPVIQILGDETIG
ncbi:MAG: histone deacetylase [Syntrophobacteraceae bacterium]